MFSPTPNPTVGRRLHEYRLTNTEEQMKLNHAISSYLVSISVVGVLVVSCSESKKADATQIRGAGERFHAITVRSNGFECTSIYETGTHGQSIWSEWKFNAHGRTDTTTYSFEGKPLASVYTPSNRPPGFDFSFYGKDGKLRTLWMSRSGSETFTDRISYECSEARLERFVAGSWQPVVEQDRKRGIVVNGQWMRLSYTNGTWVTVPSGQAANEE